jgi:predicted dehydrogenase
LRIADGKATKIGLIGAGNISATHGRAVEQIPDARVSAVYSPTFANAEQLAAAHGAAPYDSLERFFEGERLDAVIVGTPSGLHAEHGIAASRRGVHVLVEKPIDVTTAAADTLIAETARAGVTLGVIFQDRLKPAMRELKTLVDEGALGRVLLARADVPWWRPPEYYRESRWRGTHALDGGGVLINQAIHTIDLLVWLCGSPKRVFGRTATRCHAIEVEDTAGAIVEFESGAIATIEATTCARPGWPRQLTITGSDGSAMVHGDQLVAAALPVAGAKLENSASPVVSDASAHRDVIVDFISACRTGTAPCCSGRDGRRSLAVVEAIYQSSRRRGPVDVTIE